jgi:hypothetical protein
LITDDRRPGIDQVNGFKVLVVTNVHPFFDRPGHPCQTNAKLRVQLLTDRPDAPVAQVVNVIDNGF